jgi:hypothetical protein
MATNSKISIPRKYRSDRVSIYFNLINNKAFLNTGSYKETERNPGIVRMIADLTYSDRYDVRLYIPENEPDQKYLIITHKYVPMSEIKKVLNRS